jgi:hypothetical protein
MQQRRTYEPAGGPPVRSQDGVGAGSPLGARAVIGVTKRCEEDQRCAAIGVGVGEVDRGRDANSRADVLGRACRDHRDDTNTFVEVDGANVYGTRSANDGVGGPMHGRRRIDGAEPTDRGQVESFVEAAGAPRAVMRVPRRSAGAAGIHDPRIGAATQSVLPSPEEPGRLGRSVEKDQRASPFGAASNLSTVRTGVRDARHSDGVDGSGREAKKHD